MQVLTMPLTDKMKQATPKKAALQKEEESDLSLSFIKKVSLGKERRRRPQRPLRRVLMLILHVVVHLGLPPLPLLLLVMLN